VAIIAIGAQTNVTHDKKAHGRAGAHAQGRAHLEFAVDDPSPGARRFLRGRVGDIL
jgi:hypothetical protein